MNEYLFVYGTLMKTADTILSKVLRTYTTYVGNGHAQGQLYKVNTYFPGMIRSDSVDGRVYGEVYELKGPWILDLLDIYEGINDPTPLYIREKTKVNMGQGLYDNIESWIYIFNRPTKIYKRIKSGRFS